jgi:hypothetical protein
MVLLQLAAIFERRCLLMWDGIRVSAIPPCLPRPLKITAVVSAKATTASSILVHRHRATEVRFARLETAGTLYNLRQCQVKDHVR